MGMFSIRFSLMYLYINLSILGSRTLGHYMNKDDLTDKPSIEIMHSTYIPLQRQDEPF